MNPANWLTLSRLPMLYITVALLYYPTRWGATVAFFIYAIASFTDWLDGYVARKYNCKSDFGAFMDALMDKIFTLGVFVTLLVLDILPSHSIFPVLFIISREFTITGLRTIAAKKKIVIPAQGEGKIKTALQMISTGSLLLWFALKRDFYFKYTLEDIMWVYYVGYAMFLAATALTVISGLIYLVRFQNIFMSDL
ncbi:CDP-diacylglycerol--glycerol-3-phosphate 3-phosphatidyltransferase protein [Tritrichomonas foetus]|uniref:CDP-diacylglycerol--glycerol-3-phosphate 3-phosphatidyltransferase protein n=1 Tax=Tritrichomonas foetus TaxID=1144522 RepID=A0A1J4JRM2_9EUKA|nr:CDP-diacylglycerol--glycerol-3-phosphate 3-phosphatidyltransferase protein [Tritrichomonas foetus]|eukprot:OHS99900.1 CDP-diacylglycerol--glycerol-3-phosphate 3-phosphatidyltransferase protein [Tritrichomonas foetus]